MIKICITRKRKKKLMKETTDHFRYVMPFSRSVVLFVLIFAKTSFTHLVGYFGFHSKFIWVVVLLVLIFAKRSFTHLVGFHFKFIWVRKLLKKKKRTQSTTPRAVEME